MVGVYETPTSSPARYSYAMHIMEREPDKREEEPATREWRQNLVETEIYEEAEGVHAACS